MERSQIRVRFAPSPTGGLHIGGARVALFNKLYAIKTGGKLVLRIEDTDADRSAYGHEENIMAALGRLGLGWDEGPGVGGPYGPYRQSEKMAAYRQAADKLMEAGLAYRCYCSDDELERERKEMTARRQAPRYSGKCRNLSGEQRAQREAEGIRPVIRFRVPDDVTISFQDQSRGLTSFEGRDLGDFIIVRSDGAAPFLLASAVDDMEMRITDVIRGEDHLSNTPRQILLIQALGGLPPRYAHLPMVLDMEGKKLSKRGGATDVMELLDTGHPPEAINTAMAMLGWAGVDGSAPVSLEAMAERFDLERISHSPAHYDEARLESLSAKALRMMTPAKLLAALKPLVEKSGATLTNSSFDMIRIAATIQDGIGGPQDAASQILQFIAPPAEPDAECSAALSSPEGGQVIKELARQLDGLEKLDHDSYKAVVESVSRNTGIKGKKFFMAARAAITGQA
ncbi:MAG: glutamate--tRNA ligase, partial [Nitrospinota bacterium]|nr:glutamate--tRNA ligase [Nitrospinota bacterium]